MYRQEYIDRTGRTNPTDEELAKYWYRKFKSEEDLDRIVVQHNESKARAYVEALESVLLMQREYYRVESEPKYVE